MQTNTQKLKVLDLFSGIGGFSLGLERSGGFETVAFCEIDKYCQKVLKKHWPDVPIYEDVRTLNYDGPVDVISGGYPCQPFSLAGKRKGKEDDRHLWPAMFSLIKKHRPTWVIGENVAGHISMGLDCVLADLEGEDYSTRVFIIPAVSVDAKHRRDRLWIVANSNMQRTRSGLGKVQSENGEIQQRDDNAKPGNTDRPITMGDTNSIRKRKTTRQCDMERDLLAPSGREQDKHYTEPSSEDVADTSSTGCKEQHITSKPKAKGFGSGSSFEGRSNPRWPIEPSVGRVAHGIPRELDIIRGIENEFRHDKKTISKANKSIWKILLYVWENKSTAKASPDLYSNGLYNCMPKMSYQDTSGGWYLGARLEEDEGLCNLWENFYSKPFEEAQDMQQELLEQIGKKKRPQALGSRADRLKGLGNAVVPQIPEIIGNAILEAERGEG